MEVKKPVRWPLVTLMIVFLAFGIGYLILKLSGFVLLPINREAPAALSTVITAVMVLLTIKGVRSRETADKRARIIAVTMPIYAIIFVIGKGIGYVTDGIELTLLPIYGCIALACSMVLFFVYCSKEMARKTLSVIYVIVMVPMFIWLLLWDFSPKLVLEEELSPNDVYLAEIVVSDQVFRSPKVTVQVAQQHRDIELAVGQLISDPKQICQLNDYDEASNAQLKWESDYVLYVDEARFDLIN